jgi:hypothetical protein
MYSPFRIWSYKLSTLAEKQQRRSTQFRFHSASFLSMQTLMSLQEAANFFLWNFMKAKVCKTQPASILDLKQRILQQGYSWGTEEWYRRQGRKS